MHPAGDSNSHTVLDQLFNLRTHSLVHQLHQTGVALNKRIAASFSESMDPLTITTATYTLTASDVASTARSDLVAVGLKKAVEALGISGLAVNYDSATPGTLAFTNAGTSDLTVAAQFKNAGSGGLGALSTIDVSTAAGATAALSSIETMMQTAIKASAAFGSVQTRVDTQRDFVSKLTDSMKSGIGSLVDADMEEASARLQALQVQQQLSTQALSIANQQPQSLLSLFR